MIGIVAHLDRVAQTEWLAGLTKANYIAYDDGSRGCEANHRRVWKWHTENTTSEWAVTLEDDAVPCVGFRDQLAQVLTAAPTPIVSLYLGRSRPLAGWQTKIRLAVEKANQAGSHWITSTDLLHAVGVCIRTELIPDMLAHKHDHRLPIDAAISDWAKTNGHHIGYTWPSIIEHADGPTLINHPDQQPRDRPRIAWWHHTRQQWTSKDVEM